MTDPNFTYQAIDEKRDCLLINQGINASQIAQHQIRIDFLASQNAAIATQLYELQVGQDTLDVNLP